MEMCGKVVVVTGGAKGLGRKFCYGILEKGSKLCFCDVDKTGGEDTLNELQIKYGKENVMFVVCDVTNQDSFDALFQKTKEKFGSIDILINNAGAVIEGENYKDCIDVNVSAVIGGCKLAESYMSILNGGKGGVVLNVSSLAALDPNLIFPVYCASKIAVISFTRSMAIRSKEKKTGIKYVCICPTAIDVGMSPRVGTLEGIKKAELDATEPIINDPSVVVTAESVVNDAIRLIETRDNNGGVLQISAVDGTQYIYGDPISENKK